MDLGVRAKQEARAEQLPSLRRGDLNSFSYTTVGILRTSETAAFHCEYPQAIN